MIGIMVTTYNRPEVLRRSLPQIAALGPPVLVVDDGTDYPAADENRTACVLSRAQYMRLPSNRGLAAAMNVGLSYWLADRSVDWISYFQDDVDVHPALMREIDNAIRMQKAKLYTGHDSPYHPAHQHVNGYKLERSCAGLHMHARSAFWQSVTPIPTFELHAPHRIPGREKGIGSNADWWIVRDSPNSIQRTRDMVVCIPNLVRTFLYRAGDSSWGNGPRLGEDPPLRQP